MKKLIPFLCISALTFPAFAEEQIAVETPIEIQEQQFEAESGSVNPEIKFPRGMQLGLGVSATSGINGFIGYANKNFDSFWWKRLGIRFDFATTAPIESSINGTINSAIDDGQEVGDGLAIQDVDVKARHIGLLVDFYPFGNTWFLGGWRLTGGYMIGKFGIAADLSGTNPDTPGEPISFELNDMHYRYVGNAVKGRATGTWKYSGPYMGTGFDLGLFWGIKIYMDAGAVYTNKTAVMGLDVPLNNLLEVGDGVGGWDPVEGNSPREIAFNTNKEAALKDANDDLNKFKFFPMVKLGFMYRF